MTMWLFMLGSIRFAAPVSGFQSLAQRLPWPCQPNHQMAIYTWQCREHRFFSTCSTSLSISATASQRTLAPGSFNAEMEAKKSRFLGFAKHVENWNEAHTYIDEIKARHPKARHWCYAVCFGVNPVSARCSDDGEPTGTAGQPILNAIKGEELSDVVCVVVRYFGM